MADDVYKIGLSHRFDVEIGDIKLSCSKISGLEVSIEFETYREGGVNDGPLDFALMKNSGTLILERGVGKVSSLLTWFSDIQSGKFVRKNGTIDLRNAKGKVIRSWNFSNAYPVKWAGPTMDASSLDVAIETIELKYDSLVSVDKP